MAGLTWSIMARYKPMSYSSRCYSYGGDLAPVLVSMAGLTWSIMARYKPQSNSSRYINSLGTLTETLATSAKIYMSSSLAHGHLWKIYILYYIIISGL